MLGVIVESILAARALSSDRTLLLDSSLIIEGEDCAIAFLLVPHHGGAEELLALGLGSCIGLVLAESPSVHENACLKVVKAGVRLRWRG